MKTGFNMLLWTTHVTEEQFPLLEKIKQVGYDGVEIPVFEGDVEHFEKLGKMIKDNGLACASVTVIPDEQHNPISAGQTNRKGAVEHLKWAIDCSAAMNSEVLCGPLYQPLGVFTDQTPTEEDKQWAVDSAFKDANEAKKLGINFARSFSSGPLRNILCDFKSDIKQMIEEGHLCLKNLSNLILEGQYNVQFALEVETKYGQCREISRQQGILKPKVLRKPQERWKPHREVERREVEIHNKTIIEKNIRVSHRKIIEPRFLHDNWFKRLCDYFISILLTKILHKPF